MRNSNPPQLLAPAEVDEFLRVYELEVDLPSWEQAAVRQGLAMARDAAAAGFERADPTVPWSLRTTIYNRAGGRCEYCTEPVSKRRPDQVRTRRDREVDHMLSRYGLLAVGASWETIHHPANLCSGCARCNGEKGTGSLGPAELERMWEALGTDLDDPAVPLLRFYSQLLEGQRFRIRRFDEIPQRALHPALGAFRRQTPAPAAKPHAGSALLRHHPDRLRLVERISSSSDDARDLWTGAGGWRSGHLDGHHGGVHVAGSWWKDGRRPGRAGGQWQLP